MKIEVEDVMAELFILLLMAGYFIYIVAIKVPNDIRKVENKIDTLQLYIQEIEINLSRIDKKIDND